jgi:hypothetical protein
MKFFTKPLSLFILSTVFLASVDYGQSIKIIPNPSTSDYGFFGSPFNYGSNLYFQYQNSSYLSQLAKYDGTTISLIPNLSASDGGFQGNSIIYGNNLYFEYQNSSSKFQLAKYDGTTISLIPNLSASDYGYFGNSIIYGSNLYFQYARTIGKSQLAKYDGTTLNLIDNLSASDKGFNGSPIIFGSNLYFPYQNSSGNYQLAKYDGTTLSLIANLSASDWGVFGTPIIYNSNLYFQYQNSSGNYQLAKYDGTTISLIANPSASDVGLFGNLIVYGNNLYFQYKNSSGNYQLAKYDGTTLNLIDNLSASDGGFQGNPINYGSNLLFQYQNSSGKFQLAKYDGTTLSLIANLSASDKGFNGSPIIYSSNLYFQYLNSSGKSQLAKYDGTTLSLITNPSASDFGFDGSPIIYGSNLYFMYANNIRSKFYLAELINPTTWNGSSWDNGTPNSTIDAIIASSTTPGSFTCQNLTINSGNALTIGTGVTATVNGNITNNGNGISGTGNLTIALSSALSGTAISFNGVLTVNSGATLTTNSLLILSSNSTNTASLAPVAGTISGNITVERYIPSHTSRRYTFVSSPVNSPTIYSAWQEGGAATSGYGTQITGASTGSGFDAASAAGIASIYKYNDANAFGSKWVGLTNTNVNTLSAGTGYLLFVRGDRTVAPGGSGATGATTLRATGTVTTGTVTFATSAGTAGTPQLLSGVVKYNLIANPYPCAIDWTSGSITKTNLTGSFTVYDPNLGSFVTSNGSTVAPNTSNQQAKYIQSGQAFFIQNANSSTPGLVIAEAAKTTSALTASSNTVFGFTAPTAQINVNFYAADNSFADGAVAVFNSKYNNQEDTNDADKFPNFNEMVSFAENTRNLSIDARAMPVNDTLQISTSQMTANATYKIAIDGNGFDINNLSGASLIDKVTGIHTVLDLSTITNYSFTTTAASEAGRFLIVLSNKAAVVAVDNSNNGLTVTLESNPVKDRIVVNYSANQTDNTSIRLININGQPLTSMNLGTQQTGQVIIPVSQYASGLYFVEVVSGGNKIIRKVMKE